MTADNVPVGVSLTFDELTVIRVITLRQGRAAKRNQSGKQLPTMISFKQLQARRGQRPATALGGAELVQDLEIASASFCLRVNLTSASRNSVC